MMGSVVGLSNPQGFLKGNDGIVVLSGLQQQESNSHQTDGHIGMIPSETVARRPCGRLKTLEGLGPTVSLVEGILQQELGPFGVDGSQIVVGTGHEGMNAAVLVLIGPQDLLKGGQGHVVFSVLDVLQGEGIPVVNGLWSIVGGVVVVVVL